MMTPRSAVQKPIEIHPAGNDAGNEHQDREDETAAVRDANPRPAAALPTQGVPFAGAGGRTSTQTIEQASEEAPLDLFGQHDASRERWRRREGVVARRCRELVIGGEALGKERAQTPAEEVVAVRFRVRLRQRVPLAQNRLQRL
jgi:hypothetical protein